MHVCIACPIVQRRRQGGEERPPSRQSWQLRLAGKQGSCRCAVGRSCCSALVDDHTMSGVSRAALLYSHGCCFVVVPRFCSGAASPLALCSPTCSRPMSHRRLPLQRQLTAASCRCEEWVGGDRCAHSGFGVSARLSGVLPTNCLRPCRLTPREARGTTMMAYRSRAISPSWDQTGASRWTSPRLQ